MFGDSKVDEKPTSLFHAPKSAKEESNLFKSVAPIEKPKSMF